MPLFALRFRPVRTLVTHNKVGILSLNEDSPSLLRRQTERQLSGTYCTCPVYTLYVSHRHPRKDNSRTPFDEFPDYIVQITLFLPICLFSHVISQQPNPERIFQYALRPQYIRNRIGGNRSPNRNPDRQFPSNRDIRSDLESGCRHARFETTTTPVLAIYIREASRAKPELLLAVIVRNTVQPSGASLFRLRLRAEQLLERNLARRRPSIPPRAHHSLLLPQEFPAGLRSKRRPSNQVRRRIGQCDFRGRESVSRDFHECC